MKRIDGSRARKHCSKSKVKSKRPWPHRWANGPMVPSQLAKPVPREGDKCGPLGFNGGDMLSESKLI